MSLGEVLHDVLEFIEDKQLPEGEYLAISNELKGVFQKIGSGKNTPIDLSIYGKASDLGVRVVIDFKAIHLCKDDFYESLIMFELLIVAEKKHKEKKTDGSIRLIELPTLLEEYLGRYKIDTVQVVYDDIPVDFTITSWMYHQLARWIQERLEYAME